MQDEEGILSLFDSDPSNGIDIDASSVNIDASSGLLSLFSDDDNGEEGEGLVNAAATLKDFQKELDIVQPPAKRGRGRPKKDDQIQTPIATPPSRLKAKLLSSESKKDLVSTVSERTDSQSQRTQRKRRSIITKAQAKRWATPSCDPDSGHSSLPMVLQEDNRWLSELAAILFCSDGMRGPAKHTASHLGVSKYMVTVTEKRLVAIAMNTYESLCNNILQRLNDICNAAASGSGSGSLTADPQLKHQLFVRVREYDETPVRLRIAVDIPNNPVTSTSRSLLPALEEVKMDDP